MFESHFGMIKTPFARNLPTDELFASDQMSEMINRLIYACEKQLFAVVTGECGTGKTTTIRKLRDTLDSSRFELMYLADSKLTPRHFYKGLLEQLGCEAKFYRGDAKRQLHREVEVMLGIHNKRPVVILDEAHLLDKEMLEEVRFLLNFKMDAQSPMTLVLVGQLELWDKLNLQSYQAIKQRIDITCKCERMDRAQMDAYILRHLNYSGLDSHVFTESALQLVYAYSAGAPRLVNKACTHALIYAAQRGTKLLDDHMVRRVIDGELT